MYIYILSNLSYHKRIRKSTTRHVSTSYKHQSLESPCKLPEIWAESNTKILIGRHVTSLWLKTFLQSLQKRYKFVRIIIPEQDWSRYFLYLQYKTSPMSTSKVQRITWMMLHLLQMVHCGKSTIWEYKEDGRSMVSNKKDKEGEIMSNF